MTQTGEDKELVLGNKQLISLFFVVVALCGVFFAMGYMIARNSGKAVLPTDAASVSPAPVTTSAQRQQPEPPRETATTPPDTSETLTAPPTAYQGTDPAPAETKPAKDTPAATTRTEPETKEPKGTFAPEAGASYLQVTALPRADAEGVVKTLRGQNFPALLATSSKEGLFRVMVGPYHQTSQLAEAKARLKSMGFGGAFVQKQ